MVTRAGAPMHRGGYGTYNGKVLGVQQGALTAEVAVQSSHVAPDHYSSAEGFITQTCARRLIPDLQPLHTNVRRMRKAA